MTQHKLEIDRIAGAGSLYIETGDIEDISPAKDGQHGAILTVRWRSQYQESGAFEWLKSGNLLRMELLPRQIQSAVQQLRETQQEYCNGDRDAGCFDYGKASRPPASCIKCLLIEACRRSGQGDLRKASPAVKEGPGNGLVLAFCVLFAVWWWTLAQWAQTGIERDQARAALQGCQRREAKHFPVGQR